MHPLLPPPRVCRLDFRRLFLVERLAWEKNVISKTFPWVTYAREPIPVFADDWYRCGQELGPRVTA